jgi:DNA-binding LytR/AlgR family response regulator
MRLSVSRDIDGKTGIVNLSVTDVLFLEYDLTTKKVWVHTLRDRYYIPGTLSFWAEALRAGGYDFRKVDRNIVVQVPKIKVMDRTFKYAYFEDPVREKSKRITLSQTYFKKIAEKNRASDLQIVII